MKKDKVFVIVFFAIIIIISVIFAFILIKLSSNTLETNQTISNITKPTTTKIVQCKDNDIAEGFASGINIMKAGKTCIGKTCKMDKCSSQKSIVEYYCLDDKIASTTEKCAPGYFCKTVFNGSAYCIDSVQSITLKADRSKVNFINDKKISILFYSTLKKEPFNPLTISVFLSMQSESAGKYKNYDEKQMIYNKVTGRYEVSIPVKSLETYQEPITNLTAVALAKSENAVVEKSKPMYIFVDGQN